MLIAFVLNRVSSKFFLYFRKTM